MVAANTAGGSHCHGPQAVRHLRVPDGLGLLHSGLVRALRYAEEGILDVDDEQHYGVKVMIQGESRRMLRLHRSAVEKILGSLLAKNGEVGKVENMP